MSPAPTPDPFAVFGVAHALDLDARALERRWFELSRQNHPDHLRGTIAEDCAAVLQRAADINDAWRVLRDPWERARALLELRDPGVLVREQRLDPAFLDSALELAEAVAAATAEAAPALRARLQRELDADFAALRADLERGDTAAAARRFHAARYHRKALVDLDARRQPAHP